VAQAKVQRVGQRGENFARRYRKQLLPEASGDDAVSQIGEAVDDENPHAEEVPLQAVLRPFADHDGIGKAQKAEQNVVVVDLPTAADHDEDGNRIDPVHDAERQWMHACPPACS
jgi:hypothetical protein